MAQFSIRWIGQGGYALRCGGSALLVDPYFSDMVERVEGLKRLVPPPFAAQDAKPDYFLATHDHMDHLDTDMIREMPCAGVRFLCTQSSKTALLGLGKGITEEQITALHKGDTLDCGDFTLEALYASHTPDSVGLCIICEGIRLYITGDTLFEAEVGANARADVICCCINGRWGNMDAKEAVEVALRSGAKVAIPNHYGMFAENTADPADFTRAAAARGLKTYVMEYGEELDVATLLG
ncbi:MAG: MBL fold metallo-hydrolase [Oscillospiraceae bacterium]|jgi:L-ascorbate 6-phosphate lactonase|nr:MBL fold metallo-hydrolase [Oscillospiraceae bacterium]